MTEEEELFPDLLEDTPVEVTDEQNTEARKESRHTSLFSLYPFHEDVSDSKYLPGVHACAGTGA